MLLHNSYEILELLSIPNAAKGLPFRDLNLVRCPLIELEDDASKQINLRSIATSSRTEFDET